MSRSDQYAVSVSIDSVDLGVWDHMTGGDVQSEENQYRPGGMAPAIALGGIVTLSEMKVNRLYNLSRDHPLVPWLASRVGRGHCTIVKQPLDVDGNVFGRPVVYTGVLRMLNLPDADSKAGDAAIIELTITPSGTIG